MHGESLPESLRAFIGSKPALDADHPHARESVRLLRGRDRESYCEAEIDSVLEVAHPTESFVSGRIAARRRGTERKSIRDFGAGLPHHTALGVVRREDEAIGKEG